MPPDSGSDFKRPSVIQRFFTTCFLCQSFGYIEKREEEPMKKEAGLWIDHRKAVIVIVTDKGEETKEIPSNIEKHVRFSGGSDSVRTDGHQQATAEDQRDRQYANPLNRYYDEAVAFLHDAATIQLFG